MLLNILLQKSSNFGFYILAWFPIVLIVVFAIRGITRKRKRLMLFYKTHSS
jgi:hypothetical protein